MVIRSPKDFWAGLLFIGLGILAITVGSRYNLGTAARMGPGYFPRILGILLIVIGAIIHIAPCDAAKPKPCNATAVPHGSRALRPSSKSPRKRISSARGANPITTIAPKMSDPRPLGTSPS